MRFPGFAEEWVKKRFGEVGDFFKGAGISKDQLTENGNPCILYGELYTKYKNEVIKAVFSKTDLNIKGLVRSKVNDIIIPSSGESAVDIATACCVNLNDVFLGGDLNVIRPYKDNGNFISYQLNGKRKFEIAKIAQGSSVTHLYNGSLKKLIVNIPTNIDEQNKIASLLSIIDDRIAIQSKIIKDLKALKNMLRNQLFNQIIEDSYDDFSIKSLLIYEQPNKYLVGNTDYSNDASLIPVLTANKSFILGYTDESVGIYNKGECIIFDDFTMDIKYVRFPYKVKSSAIKILTGRDGVNLKFMFEYLAFLNLTSSEHKRHYISEVEIMSITIPNYSYQCTIAKALSNFDEKTELEIKLVQQFQKQKNYLLKNMFI